MTGDVQRGDLEALEACEDGLAWFDSAWPEGSVDSAGGLERLLRDERRDYLVWIGFRYPHLRALGGPDLKRSVLGPRHEALFRLHDGLPAVRWLQGTAAGVGHLQSAVDAHVRALGAFGCPPRRLFTPVTTLSHAAAWAAAAPYGTPEPRGDADPPHDWARQWRAAFEASVRGDDDRAVGRAIEEAAAADGPAAGEGPDPGEQGLLARRSVRAWLDRTLAPIDAVARQVRQAVGDEAHREVFAVARDLFAHAAHTDPAWRRAAAALDAARDEADNGAKAAFLAAAGVASAARADLCGHALWLLAEPDSADPFAPLVRLWQQGLWPVGCLADIFALGTVG
jgi:hypothetical protein